MSKKNLITQTYLLENRRLHRSKIGYGGGGHRHAADVKAFAERIDAKTILDYGCGEGTLRMALGRGNTKLGIEGIQWPGVVSEYDPAIIGKEIAQPADLLVCTDVLEHVEPDCLDSVMRHIAGLARLGIYFEIATRKSDKKLRDGRNVHLIIKSAKFWIGKIHEWGLSVTDWQEKRRKEDSGPHSVRIWVTR